MAVPLTDAQKEITWQRAHEQHEAEKSDRFPHIGDRERNIANEHGAKIALSQWLGTGVNLPRGVHVRHTSKPNGSMLVRSDHTNNAVHVLVRGVIADGIYELNLGWLFGFEAKRPDHWDTSLHYPAFRWNVDELRDMDKLPAVVDLLRRMHDQDGTRAG